jgi:hypothetical protein
MNLSYLKRRFPLSTKCVQTTSCYDFEVWCCRIIVKKKQIYFQVHRPPPISKLPKHNQGGGGKMLFYWWDAMGLDSLKPHFTWQYIYVVNSLSHTKHLSRVFIKLNHYHDHFYSNFVNFLIKKWIVIIELKKVPKIEPITVKFMKTIHMKTKIIIIIENLKP